ncbi:hypothetical protein DEIPH_ctg044orf0042 [Deinococcus phoenicis]|uniref:Acetoacetate decarboxylase n=1 Tax=Deinococcus phoenicis TaxID=1476583 RepID=A0A016QMM2_9DEIO|nr:hypothetical protein [Deinococcus phoenicis]EYB67323.1 hypothetical protein DEIPH_ctg044orf0042 [Deinococcus phoenicis]
MPPPPWTLTGRGLIAVYAPAPGAVLGALMLVRYGSSLVGPYDELLWVEGGRASPAGPRPRVRSIVVSTPQSVVWGRRNWGLPKRLAQFEWTGDLRCGQVRVTGEDGREVAHLAFQTRALRLPVTAALLPPAWRTLAQPPLDGEEAWCLTRVGGSGYAGLARLTVLHTDGLYLPLRHTRPRLTLGVPEFRLVFPVPERRGFKKAHG